MKEGTSTAKKVFVTIGNVIIWLFVIFAAVITILVIAAQSSADGIPSIGGNAILTVQTPSMGKTFSVGDIIIGHKLTPEEISELKVGDIITYDAGDLDGDNRRDLNSHRIIEIVQEDGVTKYLTKGDGNQFADATPVEADNIICRWDEGKSPRIKGVGKVLNFLQQPTGFLVAIVLPLVLFFLFELIMFIRKFVQLKNADKRQITAEDEELIRQKAIEEYIRSQQGEAPKPEAPAEEAAPAPAEEAPVAEAPAEQAAPAPAEEAPAEQAAEAPAEEAPAEQAAEAPAEEPAEEAAEEPAEESAE